MGAAVILHITPEAEWEAARQVGHYVPATFSTEGFVHCSERHQVVRVANRFFAGRRDLVLLAVDVARLDAEVRYENLEGGSELFPHVYGVIPATAVAAVTRFLPGADGRFASLAPLVI